MTPGTHPSIAQPSPHGSASERLPNRTAEGRVFSASPPPLQRLEDFPTVFRKAAHRIRAEYPELYELPVIECHDGSRSFHSGRLYRREGINVLLLKGDAVEMAFQHGRLLADQITQGAIAPTAALVGNEVAHVLRRAGRWQELLTEGIHRFVTDAMLAHSLKITPRTETDVDQIDEAAALSDATGIPVRTLVRALFAPETLMVLAKLGNDAHHQRLRLLGDIGAPVSCCSSFAAWGGTTVDGRLLVGHNLDFPLNGSYDRFPTVVYYFPTGDSQPYMTFVSAGVENAGLIAYNAAGLFLTSHTIPCNDVSAHGVPVFTIAQEVIRRATSFDSAVELFRRYQPPTGWAYLLASVKERRVGTVELSHRHMAVREAEGDFHVQTNHFLTPEMQPRNLFLNTGVAEDNDGRFLRMRQRLEQAAGRVDVKEAISILGDQIDPFLQQVRGLGNTIGCHTTMTSLVLDPSRDRAFVSNGSAPACHHDYVELPLIGTFVPDDFSTLPSRVVPNGRFRREHPAKYAALQLFIKAKVAYECENDIQRAYELLQQAAETDPTNPAYFFQRGIFALKNKRYDEAIQAFNDVLTRDYLTAQLQRLGHYYRGRTHAHLGRQDEALGDLSEVLADPQVDNKLLAAARQAKWRLRTFGRCRLRHRSLMIMMQQSDLLHY